MVIYPGGTFLARPGEPMDRFVYVEDGEIEVVNPYTNERHLPSTLGPTQFMGEIAFLNGGAWSMPMRAVRETRVIEVPREAMLKPKRSLLAAAIRRGKQRCFLAARRVACACWSAGHRLQRRCRATSPVGSPQIPESQLSMAPR